MVPNVKKEIPVNGINMVLPNILKQETAVNELLKIYKPQRSFSYVDFKKIERFNNISSSLHYRDVKSARVGRIQGQGQNEGEGQRSGDRRSPDPPRSPPRIRPSLLQGKELTFYIGGSNGVALVEGPLLEMGWKRIADKYDNYFRLKWVESKSQINYNAFRDGEQMVNHIPNCNLLTNKLGLLQSLQAHERVNTGIRGREPRYRVNDLLPETYRLDDPREREAFYENHQAGEIWICKPVGLNQGKGIYLVRDINDLKRQIQEKDEKNQTKRHHKPIMTRIIQRYITNPLLLNGKKFDIRAFMLIASTVPYLVLFHNGYARLCMGDYDVNDKDLLTHLTNQFVQKRNPERYKEEKDNTVWSMSKLNSYINDKVAADKGLDKDWVNNVLTSRMKAIMLHCFQAVKHKLQAKVGYFELYGFDFLIDSDMKVWLIEINVNPCLATNCDVLKDVIPDVVRESLYLAIECFEKSKRSQPLAPLQNLRQFQVLYNGINKTMYIPPPSNRGSSAITTSGGQSASSSCTSPTRRSASASPAKEIGQGQPNQGQGQQNLNSQGHSSSSRIQGQVQQSQSSPVNKSPQLNRQASQGEKKTRPMTVSHRVLPRATSVMGQASTVARGTMQVERVTLTPSFAMAEDMKPRITHTGLSFTHSNDAPRKTVSAKSESKDSSNSSNDQSNSEVPTATSKVTSLLQPTASRIRPITSYLSRRSFTDHSDSKPEKTFFRQYSARTFRSVEAQSYDCSGSVSPHIINFPDVDLKEYDGSFTGTNKSFSNNQDGPASSYDQDGFFSGKKDGSNNSSSQDSSSDDVLNHDGSNKSSSNNHSNQDGSGSSSDNHGNQDVKPSRRFPNSPMLLAHSIQTPAMSLGDSTGGVNKPSAASIEQRGN